MSEPCVSGCTRENVLGQLEIEEEQGPQLLWQNIIDNYPLFHTKHGIHLYDLEALFLQQLQLL